MVTNNGYKQNHSQGFENLYNTLDKTHKTIFNFYYSLALLGPDTSRFSLTQNYLMVQVILGA